MFYDELMSPFSLSSFGKREELEFRWYTVVFFCLGSKISVKRWNVLSVPMFNIIVTVSVFVPSPLITGMDLSVTGATAVITAGQRRQNTPTSGSPHPA